jgi:glycosyltransferase involved in cell wall biosynthesis
MDILFITTSIPYPPNTGGAIRAHGIIEGLRLAGHSITMLCFHEGDIPSNLGMTIHTVPPPHRSKSDRLKTLLFTRQADIAKRFYSDLFAKKLTNLLNQHPFDLIQFEGIEMVCYLPLAKQIQPSAKLVFDTFNAEYMLQRNIFDIDRKQIKRLPMALYSYLQIGRIKRYEGQMCQLADAVIAVSEEDAVFLRPLCDKNKVHVISSGIWVTPYLQAPPPIDMRQPNIVFTGKMDYRPNVDAMLWFVEAILPLIHAQMPSVHLYIVGQQPHARLEGLKSNPNITITGKVDSVLPYLYGAGVYIAPLRMGSGTRLKLLEAMACGCAIVATTIAASGLGDEVKSAMILADSAEILAENIIGLLHHPQKRGELSAFAREYVRGRYDWSAILPHLVDVYRGLGLQVS